MKIGLSCIITPREWSFDEREGGGIRSVGVGDHRRG